MLISEDVLGSRKRGLEVWEVGGGRLDSCEAVPARALGSPSQAHPDANYPVLALWLLVLSL